MEETKRLENITIENAHIFSRNFSGRERRPYNPEGVRNFCVRLDREQADKLAKDGWNVRPGRKLEDGSEMDPFLQVAVKYGTINPNIYLIVGRKKILLDEESVGRLDNAVIINVDMTVHPRVWDVNGKTGVKAYVRDMYVTVEEDVLSAKYADMGPDEDDFPF